MFTAMGRHLVKFHDQEDPDPRNQPRLPMQRQYQCADGRWVQNHGNYERFVHQFVEAAGNPDWGKDAVADFGKPLDVETADMWIQRFEETFRQRTALEWQEAISAAGGACTVCKTVEEWLDHPHPLEAKMVEEVEGRQPGRHETARSPGQVAWHAQEPSRGGRRSWASIPGLKSWQELEQRENRPSPRTTRGSARNR